MLPAVDVVVGLPVLLRPARPPTGGARTARTRHDAETEVRAARLVELPVGATEDRLVGSLDLERALAEGVTRLRARPARRSAHRGVLYVDEVNLLHDHLVDLLLDAAAMGRLTSSATASRSRTPRASCWSAR